MFAVLQGDALPSAPSASLLRPEAGPRSPSTTPARFVAPNSRDLLPTGARVATARCHDLLSPRAEISSPALAREVVSAYGALDASSRPAFFDLLVAELSSDPDLVQRSAEAYRREPARPHLADLQRAVEAPRQELFRRVTLAQGGAAALLDMRRHLLQGSATRPAWSLIDHDLVRVLKSWFNPGMLVLKRIDKRTPALLLEKLMKYEAVHDIPDWRSLHRRLENDRRCYAFVHPTVPDEPIIFTELALTRGMSASVQPILDPDAPVIDPILCNTAIFYSISSCHEGLRGLSFGNALIRQVVDELRGDLSRLRTFATLSPVPGFRSWLDAMAASPKDVSATEHTAALVAALNTPMWVDDATRAAELERRLMPLCAYYLLEAKQGAEPADPVARFHLANGARLERVNWLGDRSPAGMRRSAGVTVNYVYALADVERNHSTYVADHKIAASRRLVTLSQQVSIGRAS